MKYLRERAEKLRYELEHLGNDVTRIEAFAREIRLDALEEVAKLAEYWAENANTADAEDRCLAIAEDARARKTAALAALAGK